MYTRYVHYEDYASVGRAVKEMEGVDCQDHGDNIVMLYGNPEAVDGVVENLNLSDTSPFVKPPVATQNEARADDLLGRELIAVLKKRRNGAFPKNISMSELKSALKELNRDTSDYMMRIAAKSVAFNGVVVAGAASESEDGETVVDRSEQVDMLIKGAAVGMPVVDVLNSHLVEKEKARAAAEKMAKNAGKKPGDAGWDALVAKFEKNFGKVGNKESIDEQELKGTEGLIAALNDAIKMIGTPKDDAGKKKLEAWKKLLKTFEKKESIDEETITEASTLGSLEQALVKSREVLNKAINKVAADAKIDAGDVIDQAEAVRKLMIDVLKSVRHQAKIDKM
jgi:hypothetical protein